MITKDKILHIIEMYSGGKDFFVVDIHISKQNRISVYVDRREGITIDECADISKFIEQHLNRDKEDYELIVSSPGLDTPFKVPEQYYKNVGRDIKVQLHNGETHKGKLIAIEQERIIFEETEKKKKGKKKDAVAELKTVTVLIADIKTTKLSIEIN